MENLIIVQMTKDELREIVRQEVLKVREMVQANPRLTKTKDLMNITEAGEYLDLAVQTIYQHCSNRFIPHIKVGKRLYFRKEELDEWLDGFKKPWIKHEDWHAMRRLKAER